MWLNTPEFEDRGLRTEVSFASGKSDIFFAPKGAKKGKLDGLIKDETCSGDARITKRATASRPYELFDDPYVKINTLLAWSL